MIQKNKKVSLKTNFPATPKKSKASKAESRKNPKEVTSKNRIIYENNDDEVMLGGRKRKRRKQTKHRK